MYAYFVNKLIEFVLMLVPYFISRREYFVQFHTDSLLICFVTTIVTFILAITLVMPVSTSIMSSAIIGILIAFISYIIEIIKLQLKDYHRRLILNAPKPEFDITNCTQAELLERCVEVKMTKYATEMAIDFFINKLSNSQIAEKYSINRASAAMQRTRILHKLK